MLITLHDFKAAMEYLGYENVDIYEIHAGIFLIVIHGSFWKKLKAWWNAAAIYEYLFTHKAYQTVVKLTISII